MSIFRNKEKDPMKERLLCLGLMLLFCLTGWRALGEEAIMAPAISHGGESLPGEEKLFSDYLEHVFFGDRILPRQGARDQLTEKHQKLYDELKENIALIASGESDYAVISLSRAKLESWGFSVYFTAENTAEVFAAFFEELDAAAVLSALLLDCPYELYWYDKVAGCATPAGVTPLGGKEYRLSSLKFIFRVSPAYQAFDYEPDFPTLDTEKTGAASRAAEKAKEIVSRYADEFDGDKLKGYREEICALTDYDHEAAAGGEDYFSLTDSNPWQLIYVLDEKPETKAVCEGYSKAFQYLCDLTEFENEKIRCITVRGELAQTGGHMWNILRMEDGKNYLADITNSDRGTIGEGGELFLAGAISGDAETGYEMALNAGGKVKYIYREKLPYTEEALLLSEWHYLPVYTEETFAEIPARTALTLLPGGKLLLPEGESMRHAGLLHFLGGEADIRGDYERLPGAEIWIHGEAHYCDYRYRPENGWNESAHLLLCEDCPLGVSLGESHAGGEATCMQRAKCLICGGEYGERNGEKHEAAPVYGIDLMDADSHEALYPCCLHGETLPHAWSEETPCALCGWAGGSPLFAEAMEEGLRLGDISLSVPENQYPVPGSIQWALPLDTPLKIDGAYSWVFVPEDPRLFSRLSGSVIPFPAPEKPIILFPEKEEEIWAWAGDGTEIRIEGRFIASWQWYIDRLDGQGFVPLLGEDHPSIAIPARLEESGWRYYCLLSNSKGEAASPVITVQVEEKIVPPLTGDDFPLLFWLSLMLASLGGGMMILRRIRHASARREI